MMDNVYRLPPWRRASQVLVSLSQQERDWGLRQFRVPEIWAHTRGAGVRIAVLDTGVTEMGSEMGTQLNSATSRLSHTACCASAQMRQS